LANLDVQVFQTQRRDEAGATVDLLQVTARNLEGRRTIIDGCAVLLPLGLAIFSDPPQLDYPIELETGAQCSDFIECRQVAALARESKYKGKISLVAAFIGESYFGVRPPEHRSEAFAFDVDRWL
jgi:hypothetical protein